MQPHGFSSSFLKCRLHRDLNGHQVVAWYGHLTSPHWPSFHLQMCPVQDVSALDPLRHHTPTCSDVVHRHNHLRDIVLLLETCHQDCTEARLQAGSGHGHTLSCTRPADILVMVWVHGLPAAFDLTVTSALSPPPLLGVKIGSAAELSTPMVPNALG